MFVHYARTAEPPWMKFGTEKDVSLEYGSTAPVESHINFDADEFTTNL